jgi:hypothetical protein
MIIVRFAKGSSKWYYSRVSFDICKSIM